MISLVCLYRNYYKYNVLPEKIQTSVCTTWNKEVRHIEHPIHALKNANTHTHKHQHTEIDTQTQDNQSQQLPTP